MNWANLIIPIAISTLTGWLAVLIPGKLAFHPRRPKKLLGFTMQGIIPASQPLVAEKFGAMAGQEFFSFDKITEKLTDPQNFEQLKPEIEHHIDVFLREKLKTVFPMLAMFIGDKTINQLKAAFLMELETLFPILMKSYISRLQNDINLQQTIADKINNYPSEKLESLLISFTRKPFRQLQIFGACFGLAMGLFQILLMNLAQ